MALRDSSSVLARALVLSPFCHQPVVIPRVTPLRRIMHDVLPHFGTANSNRGNSNNTNSSGSGGSSVSGASGHSRSEEVTVLLEELPAHCDRAKQEMLGARRASMYYRSRYGRGLETQRRQMGKLQNMSSGDEMQQWARSKCILVRNPLAPH